MGNVQVASLRLSVLVFALFVGVGTGNAQTRNDEPASRRDLDRATRLMRGEISRAEKSSAETAKQSKAVAEEQKKELLKETEKARVRIEIRLAQKAREAEASTQRESARIRGLVYKSAVFLALLVGSGFVMLYWKNYDQVGDKLQPVVLEPVPPKRFTIGEKTDFRSLQSFVEDSPTLHDQYIGTGCVHVLCVLELPVRGTLVDRMRLNCTVTLRQDSASTTVQFDDDPMGSTWKNRVSRAVEIAIRKTTATNTT